MGETHVSAVKSSPYIDQVFGYEPEVGRREERCRELGITPISLDSLLAREDIPLVYIASSNDTHIELATTALGAGKAVMCEKPMGQTLEEANVFIDAERETGGFLQIGFELHYSRMYQLAKEWIDTGLIGTPVNIQCRYYCCEFHGKGSWRSNSGGSFLIGEKLSHYLDLQRWWFGESPQDVYSVAAPKVVPYFQHPDNHQMILRFPGGGVGTLNFIMYIAETHEHDPLTDTLEKQSDDGHFLQFHICGTHGAIEGDVFKRRVRRWEFREGEKLLISRLAETVSYPKEEDQLWIHNTHGQNQRIAELVARRLRPEVSAGDAYETMKLCFAAERSEQLGRIVRLDELSCAPALAESSV